MHNETDSENICTLTLVLCNQSDNKAIYDKRIPTATISRQVIDETVTNERDKMKNI